MEMDNFTASSRLSTHACFIQKSLLLSGQLRLMGLSLWLFIVFPGPQLGARDHHRLKEKEAELSTTQPHGSPRTDSPLPPCPPLTGFPLPGVAPPHSTRWSPTGLAYDATSTVPVLLNHTSCLTLRMGCLGGAHGGMILPCILQLP